MRESKVLVIALAVLLATAAGAFAQQPTTKKAEADQPGPKVPDAFVISVFAKAPDIKSPASIAVAPDGRLFVGEDEYNTQPKREQGLSRVKLCIDSNGDGVADRFTVFCDKLNSPQGMTFVGGTLYVVHAPLLTAFRDTNNDGVADTREDLITGLGPAPEGLVHHVPSGVRMGIDGWLYISIGDKGIVKATGKDGRTVSLWGGGVVRVRTDGTMMEIFSHHTRNTFDVALDPYLDAFTRDNTNDGDGWDSRVALMQRDAEYGYPSLFKHWPDEIVQPLGSYGSGSATGTLYVHDPNWPGTFGDCLYASDWARGILYRHELTRKGATFDIKQEEFIKEIRPTDLDMDGAGRMFVADWGRRDWGVSAPVGMIYLVKPRTLPASLPFADMSAASDKQLLEWLASPSAVWRINAQCELLHRKPSSQLTGALANMAMRKGEMYARVAALFTLKQLQGDESHGTIATLAVSPELRPYALRALADRDDQHYGININLFVDSLKDPSPRVRLQAAIGIGHLGKRDLAAALVPLTADNDPMVQHAAMQSLRRLNASNACIAALKDTSRPDIMSGAMRTLRSFHDANTVDAIANVYKSAATPALRQDAIRALARLYHVEAKWDGKWWTPHPDTRGPYYVREPWALSSVVANHLILASGDRDPDTAKLALSYIGLIEVKEATTTLARTIAGGGPLRDDAARALIAMKSSTPESLVALERVVLGDAFNADVRIPAAQALAGIEPAQSQPILVRMALQLDRVSKLPPGVLEKVCDGVSARSPVPSVITSLVPLLGASKQPVRVAAATALLRSTDAGVREQVKKLWQSSDLTRVEALLQGVVKLPAENSAPYSDAIRAQLKSDREPIRQAATIALGHIGDASAVKDLVALARREGRGGDPLPAVSALAGIDPARTADDQVLLIATLMVDNSAKVNKAEPTYARLVGAAQKFLNDPRVPAPSASTLRSKLIEPGVIFRYLRTDPIVVPETGEATFAKVLPPEQSPAGPFVPFSSSGKEIPWKPLLVSDPKGMQVLDMPDNSIMYLTATYDAKVAGSGYLTCGSDDGLQVWLNGKSVLTKYLDRGMQADMDRAVVTLNAGTNTLLFKVINHTSAAGIQARLRTRMIEFLPDEAPRIARQAKAIDPARGRALFTTLGCVKCHTIDKKEEPKGPFLGDVGAKFDSKYIAESILKPSAKIAQGFATERIISKGVSGGAGGGDGDYIGFVTRETADEVQLRDASGKVTAILKPTIIKRTPLPQSIMPDGLADNLTLDDFGSLLAFLEALKN